MSATSQPEPAPPFTQSREFCVLMGYAVALGVFGAFAGLVFMGVIGFLVFRSFVDRKSVV